MMTLRGFRIFEFFIVAAVIGVIVSAGISRYLELGRETRRIGFELLSHNFTTAVANARVHWLIQKMNGSARAYLDMEGVPLYMSPTGWPASGERKVASIERDLTAGDCLLLWQNLLQNPSPVSLEGTQARGERRYHIRLAAAGVCRYELVTEVFESHYFDYLPTTGQVVLNVPVNKKMPAL